MKNNQKGFSIALVLMVVVVVGLIGAVGWLVYDRQNNNRVINNPATGLDTNKQDTKQLQPLTAPASAKSFINAIQDDDSVTQITPDKIAKTADQVAILTALHNKCAGNDNYVTVNNKVFDGKSNFMQDGNYAGINATACEPIIKTLNDLAGSGSVNYLHKNSSGAWIFDTSSQMAPDCAMVDGLGYPKSIISTCYEGSTPRAPK